MNGNTALYDHQMANTHFCRSIQLNTSGFYKKKLTVYECRCH